jgi:hypothetical protein
MLMTSWYQYELYWKIITDMSNSQQQNGRMDFNCPAWKNVRIDCYNKWVSVWFFSTISWREQVNKYKQDEIIQMVDIFVLFDGPVFQQTIGIPMGTNCAPLLADLFLHAYEANSVQWLLKIKKN